MAYRLLMRYYPVDGAWNEAQNQFASFGLALWAQPRDTYYNYAAPTMGSPTEWIDGAPASTREWIDTPFGPTLAYHYASVVYFDTYGLSEGDYVEREILLLEPDSSTIRPVSPSDLPLSLVIAGAGTGGYDWQRPDVYTIPIDSWWGDFAYAGGAVEIGLDDGTTFTRLGSFWIRGGFFEPKSDGTSWDNPALPPPNLELFSLDGDGVVRVLLNADVPTPAFWTQIKQAVEV